MSKESQIGAQYMFPANLRPDSPEAFDMGMIQYGASYRLWLIGMALQGTMGNGVALQACKDAADKHGIDGGEAVAKFAIASADAVLVELENEGREAKEGK